MLDRIVDAITLDFEVLVVVDFAGRPDGRGRAPSTSADDPQGAHPRQAPTAAGRPTPSATAIDHAAHPVVVVTMADGSRRPPPDRPHGPTRRARRRRRCRLPLLARRSAGRRPAAQVRRCPAPRAVARRPGPGRDRRRHQQLQGLSTRPSSARWASTVAAASRSGSSSPPRRAGSAVPWRSCPPSGSTGRWASPQFDLKAWIPKYLRWYRFAFGPALTLDEVRRQSGGDRP